MLNTVWTRGQALDRNLMMQNCFYWCKKCVPSLPHQYWHVLLISKEELVGDMIKAGSLGCSDHKIVEFKILRGWRKESSRVQILDLRQIMAVHMRTEGSQIQEKITVTQWAWFVSKHKVSHPAMQWSWMLENVIILALIHPGQNQSKMRNCFCVTCCQLFKPGALGEDSLIIHYVSNFIVT